jgi:hypothetical protein
MTKPWAELGAYLRSPAVSAAGTEAPETTSARGPGQAIAAGAGGLVTRSTKGPKGSHSPGSCASTRPLSTSCETKWGSSVGNWRGDRRVVQSRATDAPD